MSCNVENGKVHDWLPLQLVNRLISSNWGLIWKLQKGWRLNLFIRLHSLRMGSSRRRKLFPPWKRHTRPYSRSWRRKRNGQATLGSGIMEWTDSLWNWEGNSESYSNPCRQRSDRDRARGQSWSEWGRSFYSAGSSCSVVVGTRWAWMLN